MMRRRRGAGGDALAQGRWLSRVRDAYCFYRHLIHGDTLDVLTLKYVR